MPKPKTAKLALLSLMNKRKKIINIICNLLFIFFTFIKKGISSNKLYEHATQFPSITEE